ncbi:MAG: LCP family protein [Clostridia bacterium]|nr:LCP family protein [Clostridia bacterium]
MRIAGKIILGVLCVVLAVFLGILIWFYSSFTGAFENAVEMEGLTSYSGGRQNVLIVGVDRSGRLADVIMIASFPEEEGPIHLMSVQRDTLVNIDGRTVKINSIMGYGDEKTVQKVQEVTGVPIHDYAKVNFEAVASVVDAMGGVDFDVPQDMDYEDPAQDLYIHLKAGYQHLNGQQALQLLRFRGYPMADIERTKVQRSFLQAMLEQKNSWTTLFDFPEITDVLGDNMTSTIDSDEAMDYAKKVLNSDGVQSHEMPYTLVGNGSLYLNEAEMQDLADTYFR